MDSDISQAEIIKTLETQLTNAREDLQAKVTSGCDETAFIHKMRTLSRLTAARRFRSCVIFKLYFAGGRDKGTE